MRINGISLLCVAVLIVSCKKDSPFKIVDNGPATPYEIPNPFNSLPDMEVPSYNPTTAEGIRLGRKLYYDEILSMNNKSCSSCHPQVLSFTKSSMGPNGMQILPHINLGWNKAYGWNGETTALDSVALADLEHGNVFLNANNDSIKARISNHPEYPQLFHDAFGIDIREVSTSERQIYISYALAQFMRTLVSSDSKFDRYLRGETDLSPMELYGLDIFYREDKGDCFHCHGDVYNPLWTDNLFHNNGLKSTHSGNDLGRYNVTGNPSDIGKFKTPTLRNVELTAPYMHDGSFSSLEEVVAFYSFGLQDSPTIDPLMKNVDYGGALLNPTEQAALVAFLKTLTDTDFLFNSAYSAP